MATNIMSEKQRKACLANLSLSWVKPHSKLYENAGGENAALPEALAGDIDPVRIARRETPVHRTMVNMAVAGYTNREIAMFTGYSPATVATAIKQPHARKYMIQEAKKTVQDEIKELLASEALPSIKRLITVRDSQDARSSDVIAASNSLLDRFLGKPVQPITENQKPPSEMTDAELKAQVELELRTNTTAN